MGKSKGFLAIGRAVSLIEMFYFVEIMSVDAAHIHQRHRPVGIALKPGCLRQKRGFTFLFHYPAPLE